VERLTKRELRALLDFIKDCYPICDLETFSERVISRLAKIVPREFIVNSVVKPGREQNASATYSLHIGSPSKNKNFARRIHEHPIFVRHEKKRDTAQGQFHRLASHGKFDAHLGIKYRIAQRLIKQVPLDRRSKVFSDRNQILFNLLSPYVNQAYRNAQTVTHLQEKLTLVDLALYRLSLGLIFLTPEGKICLATTWAMQQLTSYLGPQFLRKNCLPEPLWRLVKQQEIALASKGKNDVLLQQNPLVLAREMKRLVIRPVFDFDQILLLLQEQSIMPQPQALVAFGLSPREAQVLSLVVQGKTDKEIGMILALSTRTVQKHLEHIYQKVGVQSRTAAVAKAYEIPSIASKQTGIFFLVLISLLMT
jgi:DNA-binding CsgD family transcriptional regulator